MDTYTGPKEDVDYISPNRPVTLVCVDGSEESERAFRWAMKNLPRKHGLMLVHGVKIPYSTSIEVQPQQLDNYREHNRLTQKYMNVCREKGRACGMAHFHYQKGDAFGDGVCSYARLRGAEGIVTGRRNNISNTRRAVFGSGSMYVLAHCPDIPVTVVTAEANEND